MSNFKKIRVVLLFIVLAILLQTSFAFAQGSNEADQGICYINGVPVTNPNISSPASYIVGRAECTSFKGSFSGSELTGTCTLQPPIPYVTTNKQCITNGGNSWQKTPALGKCTISFMFQDNKETYNTSKLSCQHTGGSWEFIPATSLPVKTTPIDYGVAQATGCYHHTDSSHKEGDPVLPPITEEQCGINYPTYYWMEKGATSPSAPLIKCNSKYTGELITTKTPLGDCSQESLPLNMRSGLTSANGTENTKGDNIYTLLAPFTTDECERTETCFKTFNPAGKNAFGHYLNIMINILIGLAAVFAVIVIVMGGIQYMTSELAHTKEQGKSMITNAIFGLVLALGAYTLLNTLNPSLLRTDIEIDDAKLQIQELQIAARTSSTQACIVPASPTSPCHSSKLGAFGSAATQASAICAGESLDGKVLDSGVDMCKDGNSFSFGLFQINVIAHRDTIPGGICSGVFKTNGTRTMQGNILNSNKGIPVLYDCEVVNQSKFQQCTNYIKNPVNNIAYAANLQKQQGWRPWGFNTRACRYP